VYADDRVQPVAREEDEIMELSARNQLEGKIKEIVRGAVMGEVIVDVGGGQTMTSTISLSSIDRLALRIGDAVVVVVKATDVMIGK
jgi:molybdopterin-binding protein